MIVAFKVDFQGRHDALKANEKRLLVLLVYGAICEIKLTIFNQILEEYVRSFAKIKYKDLLKCSFSLFI